MAEPTENEQSNNAQVLCLDGWCIYRVPSQLRHVDEAAYTPQTLSIGPLHRGNPKLSDMEAHKKTCYNRFLERSLKSEEELNNFMTDHQEAVQNCYGGTFKCDIAFMKMILVDACFIIELFMSNSEQEHQDANYYILRSPWLRKSVVRDLILFENQLPYFLLQTLFDFAEPQFNSNGHLGNGVQEKGHAHEDGTNSQQSCFPCFQPGDFQENPIQSEPSQHQFLELTCKFFDEYSKGNRSFIPKNFTDLVRHFLCPNKKLVWVPNYEDPVRIKYQARKLKAAGVKFVPLREPFITREDQAAGVKVLNFPCSLTKELKLTRLWAEYETDSIFRNIMAMEQLVYPDQPYICGYFLLLNQLIKTEEDVDVLIEDKVIFNLLGSNKAVVSMISSLCEQIKEDKSCYADICQNINKHYQIFSYHPLVILRQVYFKDLWRASSAILGFVVLVFSVLTSLKKFELL